MNNQKKPMNRHVDIEQLDLENEAMFILKKQIGAASVSLDQNLLLEIYREAIIINGRFDSKVDAQKAMASKFKKLILSHNSIGAA